MASIPRKNAFSSVGVIFFQISLPISRDERGVIVWVDPVSLWRCRNMDLMVPVINALG